MVTSIAYGVDFYKHQSLDSDEQYRGELGFTLIELLVVFAIGAILISTSVVLLGKLAPSFDLDNAALMTALTFKSARMQAVSRGHAMAVVFDGHMYTVTDTVAESVIEQGSLPMTLHVSAEEEVTFTPLGTTTSAGLVSIENSAGMRNVSVGISGEVQVQ